MAPPVKPTTALSGLRCVSGQRRVQRRQHSPAEHATNLPSFLAVQSIAPNETGGAGGQPSGFCLLSLGLGFMNAAGVVEQGTPVDVLAALVLTGSVIVVVLSPLAIVWTYLEVPHSPAEHARNSPSFLAFIRRTQRNRRRWWVAFGFSLLSRLGSGF